MNKRKKLVSILAGIMAFVMILSLILSIIPAASAASSSEIKKQIEALQKQRQEMQEMRAGIEADLQANEDEIAKIIAEKNVIDQEIGILYAEIININDTISAYNLLIADKQDELDAATARWEDLNEKNKERVRTMEEEGELSYWSVLFKANSFSDLLDRLVMVEEIAAADQRRLKELNEAAEVVEEARDELKEEKAGIEATKAELDAAEALLQEKRQAADDLINELLAKGQDIHDLLHEAEDAEADLADEIAASSRNIRTPRNPKRPPTGLPTGQPTFLPRPSPSPPPRHPLPAVPAAATPAPTVAPTAAPPASPLLPAAGSCPVLTVRFPAPSVSVNLPPQAHLLTIRVWTWQVPRVPPFTQAVAVPSPLPSTLTPVVTWSPSTMATASRVCICT